MQQAYTPALQVTPKAKVSKLRELPLAGKVLVRPGDEVRADDAVLSAELPGDLTIVRVADRMGFEPHEVVRGMKAVVGQSVAEGQLLCEIRTFFGFFTSQLLSPSAGTVEFFTSSNAHLGIRHAPVPLFVNAYISGIVSGVEEGKAVTIETDAALVQGIFGVGGERQGVVYALNIGNNEQVTVEHIGRIKDNLEKRIIVGGLSFTADGLAAAAGRGVSAVITGSVDSTVLREFTGREIAVSVTGDEDVPFTLIITEGFGKLPVSERVMNLARHYEGKEASVNGATQVRAGAMRPELIIPLAQSSAQTSSLSEGAEEETRFLRTGARVRIIRVPYFGQFGEITAMPPEPQRIPSGALVRVLDVHLDNGDEVVVPRANVELV